MAYEMRSSDWSTDVCSSDLDGSLKVRRMTCASEQTWAHRAKAMDAVIASLAEPRVSVIVLACNNIAFTRACLHSLAVESNWRNLEIIVVDNASDDGTRDLDRKSTRLNSSH